MDRVGLIGLGAVGNQLALVLAENGYNLLVADARPRAEFEAPSRAALCRARFAAALGAQVLMGRGRVVPTDVPRTLSTYLMPLHAAVSADFMFHVLVE